MRAIALRFAHLADEAVRLTALPAGPLDGFQLRVQTTSAALSPAAVLPGPPAAAPDPNAITGPASAAVEAKQAACAPAGGVEHRPCQPACRDSACTPAEGAGVPAAASPGAAARAAGVQPLHPGSACAGAGGREGGAAGAPPFNPDAAIVNYYRPGDTLNGHQDDVEADLRQPIVSLSVGCDAVFLIGGATKAAQPTALLLSSGDVVVMRSDARLSYHGAPTRVRPAAAARRPACLEW